MSTRSIAIQHNGKTYSGYVAVIKNTSLGWESHGILTASLTLSWDGSGISSGGYCLDSPLKRDGYDKNRLDRVGTAYGLDHIMRIMHTVGVDKWEALPGKQVIVLFDSAPGESTWGATSVGIANSIDDRVLIFAEHANEWRDK